MGYGLKIRMQSRNYKVLHFGDTVVVFKKKGIIELMCA